MGLLPQHRQLPERLLLALQQCPGPGGDLRRVRDLVTEHPAHPVELGESAAYLLQPADEHRHDLVAGFSDGRLNGRRQRDLDRIYPLHHPGHLAPQLRCERRGGSENLCEFGGEHRAQLGLANAGFLPGMTARPVPGPGDQVSQQTPAYAADLAERCRERGRADRRPTSQ